MSKKSTNERTKNDHILRTLLVQLVIVIVALGFTSFSNAYESADSIQLQEITVYKSPMCGCCSKWVEHLQKNGFKVEVRTVNDTTTVKQSIGVPGEFKSCHTAVVGDYWIEGHVPADVIRRLLEEQPDDVIGIAVPGMPPGSPGMESTNPTNYKILRVYDDGEFSDYDMRMGESVQ